MRISLAILSARINGSLMSAAMVFSCVATFFTPYSAEACAPDSHGVKSAFCRSTKIKVIQQEVLKDESHQATELRYVPHRASFDLMRAGLGSPSTTVTSQSEWLAALEDSIQENEKAARGLGGIDEIHLSGEFIVLGALGEKFFMSPYNLSFKGEPVHLISKVKGKEFWDLLTNPVSASVEVKTQMIKRLQILQSFNYDQLEFEETQCVLVNSVEIIPKNISRNANEFFLTASAEGFPSGALAFSTKDITNLRLSECGQP